MKNNEEKKKQILEMKPLVTEKAVMMIEAQNVLAFKTNIHATKKEIQKEVEELFEVKVDKVRVMIRESKKYTYVKLKKEFPAIDVATKLGMI